MRMLWLVLMTMLPWTFLSTSALADGAARAKILRCSQRNPQRCEVALRGGAELGHGAHDRFLEFYHEGKLVYRATEYRATSRRYKRGTPIVITSGSWQTSRGKRERLLRDGRVLSVKVSGDDELDAAFGGEEQDELASEGGKSPRQDEGEQEIDSFDKLEKWAAGDDGAKYPRVVASLKLGTPNSPTAMRGIAVDTFLASSIMPLTIGFGDYDSERFIDKRLGRIRYSTTSLGTGLLIGKGAARFKAGISYVDIKATSKAGEEKSRIETFKRHYTGLCPSIGIYSVSSGGLALNLDYGHFLPLSGRYAKDFGAPISHNEAQDTYRNRNQFVSLGLGIGF